jgi:hypothetical protein
MYAVNQAQNRANTPFAVRVLCANPHPVRQRTQISAQCMNSL